MKRALIPALFALLPAAALASAPISTPVSIGKPHVCMQNYPAESIRLGQQGRTTLSFHITPQGTVSNVVVTESSGFELLDQAAVACAAEWQYRPAMQDGQPVEVAWQAKVRWSLFGGDEPRWDLITEGDRCGLPSPPTAAQLARVRGMTILSVTLAQGRVAGTTLVRSSGNAELDALAPQCFNQAQVIDPDGKPVSAVYTWAIEWVKPAATHN